MLLDSMQTYLLYHRLLMLPFQERPEPLLEPRLQK
jgi:hypothetical protein